MIATIVIGALIAAWFGYVVYRRFFDKKNPLESCGLTGGACSEHHNLYDEYRKDHPKKA